MPVTLNAYSFSNAPVLASTVRLISSASDGTAANNEPGGGLAFDAFFGQVYTPAVSTTGRYVAFKSLATNLVPDDTNGFRDVFWKDTLTGVTKRVDVATSGAQSNANDGNDTLTRLSISNDGRYVAFVSAASNLVAGDTNGHSDVFVRDTTNDTTIRVSTATGGAEADRDCFSPRISGNGRFVAFSSHATNLVAGDTNNFEDIFVRDLQTGITTSFTQPFNQFISRVQGISNDGRYILFVTDADNILPGGNGEFVYDRQNAVFTRVNAATNGTVVTGDSLNADTFVLSGDGRHVAFVSGNAGWGPTDTNNRDDVFVKNLDTGVVTLVSASATGQQAMSNFAINSISDNGRYVSFGTSVPISSTLPAVFGVDAQGTQNFVKDMVTGTLTDITRNGGGTSVPGGTFINAQLSGDGATVTYAVGYGSPVLPGVRSDVVELFQTTVAGADVVRETGDNRTVSLSVNTTGATYIVAQTGDFGQGYAGAVPVGGTSNLSFHFGGDYVGDFIVYGSDGATFSELLRYQAIVRAAAGNAIINGTSRDNIILGGNENNTITDTVGSGASRNYIDAGGGNDTVTGGAGQDTLIGGTGADNLDGGGGWDTANYADAASTVQVVMYNTTYNTGEAAGDTFTGIEALQGSAHIDILVGDFLQNAILGGAGGDWIDGTYGGDYLYGEAGNDSLVSRNQADVIDGGADFDYARYDYADVGLRAFLYDHSQNSGWAAGDSYVSIEGLAGSYLADDLRGDASQNIIYGLGGADFIVGLGGSDLVIGGAGADFFHFVGIGDGGAGGDVIQDFTSGQDRISVTGAFFGLGSPGPGGAMIDSWRFVSGTAATVASSQFIYNAATRQLFYDQDGTGAGAQVLLATLQAGATMAAGDIIVL
jgi:RTX calcium-binding nonapeptide repeat (4 copies)